MRQVFTRKTVSRGMAVVFLLLILASVYFGNAGSAPGPDEAVVKPAVPLEEAIRIVRTNFEVPADCVDFTSQYNGSKEAQSWTLQWNAPSRPGLFCSAQVNAANGEILSFNMYRPDSQPGIRLREPGVSIDTARATANRLVEKVAAAHLDELRSAGGEVNILGGLASYTFRWERVISGVPFPANGVSVQVSGDDGQVTGYYLSWLGADFPDAAAAISPNQARQAFENAGMLELQYFQPFSTRAFQASNLKAATDPEQPVLLVYKLVHPSGGVIDAIRGTPLEVSAAPVTGKAAYIDSNLIQLDMPSGIFTLRPEEIREIEKLAVLLSQEQAAAAVSQWLPAAGGMTLQSASLAGDRQAGITVWNLNFNAAAAGRPGSLAARVNALTGELLGFDLSPVSSFGVRWQSCAAAQKMAGEFLQRVQPQRFQETELEPDRNPAARWKVQFPPVEYFKYRRVVNGIPFPNNYIDVNVDARARRLVHYGLNWSDLEFPAPQGVLSLTQAYAAFYESQPLVLMYVREEQTGNIKLVYQPQARPGMQAADLLDARTGVPLSNSGQPVVAITGPRRFTDISGVPEAREIELLGQAGLFGEYGDAFRPDEPVALAPLLRAMLELKDGVGSYSQVREQEILSRAWERGWLKEDLQPDSQVSRELLAKLTVRMLGLERAALAPGIYRVSFTDIAALSSNSAGYVALAWGLGIMKEDGPWFHPWQPVTRAEAAAALVRAFQ